MTYEEELAAKHPEGVVVPPGPTESCYRVYRSDPRFGTVVDVYNRATGKKIITLAEDPKTEHKG